MKSNLSQRLVKKPLVTGSGSTEIEAEEDQNNNRERSSGRLDFKSKEKNMSTPSRGTAPVRQDSNETYKQMRGTYTAVEVSAPGTFRVVERRVSGPGPGQVRIRVEAFGICHTDAATVNGIYLGLTLPRVLGHEPAGRLTWGFGLPALPSSPSRRRSRES
jgi:hypothetical protein